MKKLISLSIIGLALGVALAADPAPPSDPPPIHFPTGPLDPGTNVPCGNPCPRPGHPPQRPPLNPTPKPCLPCINGEGYDCENNCRV